MSEATHTPIKPGNAVLKIALYLITFGILWYGITWWNGHKVASDAVDKFEIAQRNGDRSTACFQAGMAASAYLSNKNEDEYKKWRQTEATICTR
jgi:hypothetical protein